MYWSRTVVFTGQRFEFNWLQNSSALFIVQPSLWWSKEVCTWSSFQDGNRSRTLGNMAGCILQNISRTFAQYIFTCLASSISLYQPVGNELQSSFPKRALSLSKEASPFLLTINQNYCCSCSTYDVSSKWLSLEWRPHSATIFFSHHALWLVHLLLWGCCSAISICCTLRSNGKVI